MGGTMTAPQTRNWSANEIDDFVGHKYHIVVDGEVQTPATNMLPKLSYHQPQGFNPRILMLDLTIEQSGEFGGQVVLYHKADYKRPTSGDEYDEVNILFDGTIIKRIKVGHPKTAGTAGEAAKAAAAPAGEQPPKQAAKKPAKKAAKKPAKKSAKKSAKKAPKKTAKKTAKKAAKRTGKKKTARKKR